MPLNAAQLASLSQAADESLAVVTTLSADLSDEQHDILIEYLTQWDEVKLKTKLEIAGGRDGVRLSFENARNEIRREVRNILGLTLISDKRLESDGNTMQLLELDLGVNYG